MKKNDTESGCAALSVIAIHTVLNNEIKKKKRDKP